MIIACINFINLSTAQSSARALEVGVRKVFGANKGMLIRQFIGESLILSFLSLIIAYILIELFLPVFDQLTGIRFNLSLTNNWGFLLIFIAILCLGWVISWAFSKMMKGSLKFLNHILGGVLGLIKGVLICGIIVFALLVFPVNARVLKECQLAPYCLRITKAVYYLIPQELKERFNDAYRDIVERKGRDAERI